MVKTKPTKHKEDNTFKFQTFAERLNSVNVDIVHRLDLKRNLVPDETDTFFFECLEKWVDLNCTEGYTSFCRQLGHEVQSLGQLLLNQERIISLLIEKIDKENVLFLEPILELVVALSKDIVSDFYPHFSQFFQRLVDLLQTREPQIIEWTFTTLAHLYKNLWRNLVKDIENVYELLLPLLASGKPPHIQQFASESFSFIGRKVSNKTSFVELIFAKLLLKPDDSLGVGQLLFHLVKGVKEQFHTCLDVFLPLFLKHVSSVQESVKTNPVFCAVEHCFLLMSRHTTTTHCSKVWKLLQQEIATSTKPGVLGPLLLILQWISFKEGELVNDNVSVTNTLISLLKENLLEEEQETVASACATLIMSTKSSLSIEQITRLGNLIYHSSNWKPKVVLDFTLKVAIHAYFESHLIQHYMTFCNSIGNLSMQEHSQLLDNLARLIIIKNPLPQSGYDIDIYKTYPLDFSFAMRKTHSIESVPKLIKTVLESGIEQMVCENLALYVDALICLPNVLPVGAIGTMEMLKRIIQEIAEITASLDAEEPQSKKPKTDRPADFKDKLGLVLSLAILAARHFSSNLLEHLPWSTMKSAFLNESTSQNVFYLRSIDFYMTSFYGSSEQDALYSAEVLNQLYEIIGRNICSPYREVRLVTLHILSLFSPPLPTPPENVHSTSVFQICLQAEMVAIGVTEQREKFNYLQNLEAERVVYSIPIGGRFKQVPLQYLLSQFYVNFRPLWDPVMKLIESHAFSMDSVQFWSIYFSFLELLNEPAVDERISSNLLEEFEFLNIETSSERLDFSNARSLMWTTMSHFGRITEEQHSVLVPRFLDFWNKEYCANDTSVVQIQDLTAGEELKINAAKGNHGNLMKLLIAHLSVLASFNRPKIMCREPEVTTILHRLLSHRSSDVQKKALDCLVAYGFPYLLPYKDNLYRLLDDKTFRSEITLFSIDTSSSSILAEHRHGLITILMRLLYGKMMFKAGSGSSSKDNVRHRQEIVLRYIGGFNDGEIDAFLDLSFQLFKGFSQTGNIYEHIVSVMTETNPTQALPLKRVQGALGFMGIIFSKLGNLIKSTQPKLLTILLNICAHVMGLLAKRDQCKAKHLALLKELRSLGLQRLTQFFTKFESYPWSASEIEAVFHVAVWPQLELLSVEGLQSPTPLLRLFQVWSENPRYFVLFGKGHPVRREMCALPIVLDMLICSKTHSSVCSFIMDIVEKLASTADYGEVDEENKEEKEEIVHIVPNFCVELQPHMSADSEVKPNYGSSLLIPYMSPIILHLRKVLSHGLNGRDLNVLMRLSEYVSEPQLSTELARLVITAIKAIVNRRRNVSSLEDKLTRYLNILVNLVNNSVNPQEFVGTLAAMFGSVSGSLARQALCRVLEVMCVRDPSIKELGDLVASLNAWDRKRVDQPDFMHRLNTHKKINATLESGTPTFEWTILVLYNSFYFIKKEEDTSLRDSASFSLQQMTKAFERLKFGKTMLNDHFIPQLRLLIQSENETIRHEAVSILSQAVVNCGGLNAALNSLRKLRKAGDVETDFFENSRHLQTHRRSRALLRLSGLLKQEKRTISNETVTQFLLPLATCYLFTEAYATQNHLIDAALECLQAIARSLSWPSYEKLLRFYLSNMTRQMQYQKQAVKAVVAILNGFHFDLKNSQFKSYYVKKAKELQSKSESENISASVVIDASLDGDEVPTLPDLDVEEEAQENEEKSANFIKEDMATKIHSVIVQSLLPDLNSILTARSKRELQHKSTKQDHCPEDDEILRVPIALALVNLLKNLPSGALERNLPGLFSKVVTFLKSRSSVVRETARDTIIQIIVSLGPEYLSLLMEATSPVLQRGFQVHVYIYTIHSLLVKLVELGQLKSGSLDNIIYPLVELCKKELYGDTADEKEVAEIIGKVKEAKGVKAYDTFEIIGKYVSQSHLLNMILPLKEVLASTRSFKMTKKVEECLQRGALGLSANEGLVVDQLLIFVYGVVSLSIPQLQLPSAKPVEHSTKTTSGRPLRTDSLIIAPPPKRKIAAAAQASVSGVSRSAYIINSHFIVEFGLLVLSNLLKRDNLCFPKDGNSGKVLSMLDPLIPVAYTSLNDSHAKLVALSLRCICTLLRAPLPSVNEYAPKISMAIFTLLHKYAGSTSGDNFEMLQTAFKAISVLIRHVKCLQIDEDQLRILLTHAEQALWDPKLQSISFGLLKTIVKKKLTLEELPQVMMRLAELSIKSDAIPVRVQSRKLVLQYLIDYPLGKKVVNYLEFFLAQLEYENEVGRLSAIEFLVLVFNTFPKNLLTPYSSLFFVTISPRLINETSASCVKAIATSLRTLLENLNTPTKSNLFDIALTWMNGRNDLHKRLAVQLCGIFVAAERENFESRIEAVLPSLVKLLDVTHSELEDRDSDLLLIQTHYAIIKMTQHCPVGLQNVSFIDDTDKLWEKVIHNLLHPHLWIRTLGARLVGTLFGWHKVDELAAYALTPSETAPKSYLLCTATAARLLSLTSDSVAQLQSEQLDSQLVDQVIKNLVFLGKVASRLPSPNQVEVSEEEEKEEKKEKSLNLPWLTGKLRRELHAEVALNPKVPTKRLAVFKWMAAIAVDLNNFGGKDKVLPMLQFFIPPLTREANDDGAPEEVRKLSQEVAELIKGIVGTEAYSEALVKANCNIAVRRQQRVAAKKAESVTKPDKIAQSRIKKHFAKRVAMKVKIARLKGVRPKLKGLVKKKIAK